MGGGRGGGGEIVTARIKPCILAFSTIIVASIFLGLTSNVYTCTLIFSYWFCYSSSNQSSFTNAAGQEWEGGSKGSSLAID